MRSVNPKEFSLPISPAPKVRAAIDATKIQQNYYAPISPRAGQIGKLHSKRVQLTNLPSSGSVYCLLNYKFILNDYTKNQMELGRLGSVNPKEFSLPISPAPGVFTEYYTKNALQMITLNKNSQIDIYTV